MRGRKRTKAQREEDLARIAEMHACGMSQAEIAAALGFTQQQISHDLKEIYRRWSAPEKPNLHTIKARILAELNAQKKQARKAWEKSQATKETSTQKQVKTPGGVVGEGESVQVEPDKERNEASLRTEERDGSVAFLKEIRECIKMECQIHGLNAAAKVELSGGDGPPIRFIEIHRPPSVPPPAQTEPLPSTAPVADLSADDGEPPPIIPRLA
jgi:hypothetical protein